MTTGIRIRFRRDIKANWDSVDPILDSGELGYVTDLGQFKIGNGVDTWSTLTYFSPGTPDGSIAPDSDWILRQVTGGATLTGADSDWVLRQISDPSSVDSEWVLSLVGDTGSYFYQTLIAALQNDSEQPLADVVTGGPDSEWVLAQVEAETKAREDADSDLSDRISAIETGEVVVGPDSEWVLSQIAEPSNSPLDSDWVLSQITAGIPVAGADSEYVLAQVEAETKAREDADSDLDARLTAIETGEVVVGPDSDWVLAQIPTPSQVDSDWVIKTVKQLDVDSDWILKQIYTKAQSDSDLLSKTQVTNTLYVNTGGNTLQDAINKVGTQTARQIVLRPGSIGQLATPVTFNNSNTLIITGPAAPSGSPAVEILGNVTIQGATSTRLRFAHVQFDGTSEISGTEGRHTFKGCIFEQLHSITGATTNFLVYEDVTFDGGFSVANTFGGVLFFIRCAFNNIAPTLNQFSNQQVVFADCSGLPSFPTNATLVGRNSLTSGYTRSQTNELIVGQTKVSFLDSDWVLSQIPTPSQVDSEWVLSQIADPSNSPLDSDWVLSQIPTPSQVDSEWVLSQIPTPSQVDSEWVLSQIPTPSQVDSDWVLRQSSAGGSIYSEFTNESVTPTLGTSWGVGSKTFRILNTDSTKFAVGDYIRIFPVDASPNVNKSHLSGNITAITAQFGQSYHNLVVNVTGIVYSKDRPFAGAPVGQSYLYWRFTNKPSFETVLSGETAANYNVVGSGLLDRYLKITDQNSRGDLIYTPVIPRLRQATNTFARLASGVPQDVNVTNNTWIDVDYFRDSVVGAANWQWSSANNTWTVPGVGLNPLNNNITISGVLDFGTQTFAAGDSVIVQFIDAGESPSGTPTTNSPFLYQFRHDVVFGSSRVFMNFSATIPQTGKFLNSGSVNAIRMRLRINTSTSKTLFMLNPTADKWSRIDLTFTSSVVN